MAFISLLDDRAKPKGSRDPLGFELVWTHFGRKIIGNLTTITSSLNNFSVALLGFCWANEIHAHEPKEVARINIRETFLQFEQLASYLRFSANDKDFMGITRVTQRMGSPNAEISLGMSAQQQILSDQASYGLWGLYSAAMKESGLIDGENRKPTDLGLSIVKKIESQLHIKPVLLDVLQNKKTVSKKLRELHSQSFLVAVSNKQIQEQLLHILMKGSDRHEVQQELWRVTQVCAEAGVSVTDIPTFVQQVKAHTDHAALVKEITRIEAVERLLVASNNLFHYCRRKDGERLVEIFDEIDKQQYSYLHLAKDMDLSSIPHATLLFSIRNALLGNNHAKALTKILELNSRVMKQRDGAPWVKLDGDNTLRVKVRDEKASLCKQTALENSWDYDYFLTSFIKIASNSLGTKWTVQ